MPTKAILEKENTILRRRVTRLEKQLAVQHTAAGSLEHADQFKQAFHASTAPQMISRFRDEQILQVNDAFCQLLGYQRDELVGHSTIEMNLWANLNDRVMLLDEMYKHGRLVNAPVRLRTRSGKIRTGLFSSELVVLDGTEVLVTTVLDDTDHKQAIDQLRESENKYRDLINGMNDTVWVIDDNTTILDVNNAAVNILGYTRQELLSMKIQDIDVNLKPLQIQHLADTMPADKTQVFETAHTAKDGRILPVEISSSLISYKGRPAILSIARDITERKQAETQVRESEKRLRSLLEISRALTTPLELNTILQMIVDNATQMVNLDSGALYTLQGDQVFLAATTPPLPADFPDIFRCAPLTDHPHIQQAITTGSVIILPDTNTAELSPAERTVAATRGLRSIIYLPLGISTRTIGVLILASVNAPRTFSDAEIALYSGFTGQAAQTIENGQLYQSVRHYATEMEMQIAERKQAEEQLRGSEERFTTLFRSSPSAMALSRVSDNRLTDINDAWENITGWSRDQAIGKTPMELNVWVNPAERERLKMLIAEHGAVHGFEMQLRSRNGTVSDLLMSAEVVNLQGEPCLLSMTQDITARKQAEEKLRESEHRYRTTLDNMMEGCQIIGPAWHYLYINPAAAAQGHHTSQALQGHTMMEMYPGIENTELFATLSDCMHNRVAHRIENEFRYLDGSQGWFDLSITPVPEGIFILSVDITARKQAHIEVDRVEKRYRAMIENAPDGFVLIDVNGKFKYASPSVERIFGYTQDDLQTCDSAGMTHPEDLGMLLPLLAKLIQDPTYNPTLQYRFRHKNGEWRWIESTFSNLLALPSVQAIIINFRDIHERKQAEEALTKSQALLKEAQRIGHIGHMEWNSKDQALICSDEVYDILGLPHGQVITQQILGERMTPAQRERIQDLDLQMIQQQADLDYEYSITMEDGRERWIHQVGKITYNDQGAPIRMLAIIQDVTERKQTENIVRANEERFRTVADFTYDMEYWLDENHAFQYISPSCERMTGYSRAEFLQTPALLQTIIHPADRVLYTQHLAEEFSSQEPCSLDFRIITRDGNERWFNHTCQRVYNTQGQPRGRRASNKDITDRKITEQALRASEEKYRGLTESLDNTVATIDYNGKFLYVNDTAAEQLGGTVEQLTGKHMEELFPPHIASRQLASIRAVIEQNRAIVSEELTLVRGQPRWYRTSIQPIHDEHGQVIHALINSTDIHELKTIQKELQELNRSLEERVQERTAQVQDLYENAPVGYHSLDADGNYISINQTELNWLGYSREELLGKPITSIYTPPSIALFQQSFPLFKTTGKTTNLEAEAIRKDGTTFPVLINAVAIYDEQGHYVSSRSTMADITQRKHAENELKRSINFMNVLLDAIPTPVFYKDQEGRYLGCNLAFSETIGKTAQEIKGKTAHQLWPNEHADVYHQKDLELMQRGERQVYDSVAKHKDGSTRPVIFIKDVFMDERGQVAGLVGTFIDISERKQAEETLRRANLELERTLRMKDEFLANMSHELRTPLNAILGLSETLQEQLVGPLNEMQTKSLATIQASGQHLLALINDILDLSKIEAGAMTLDLSFADAKALCDASLLFVRQAAHKKRITLMATIDPDVQIINVDERRTKQMLVNLLSNAVKFTPEGGRVGLEMRGDRHANTVRFTVWDTGIGISPEGLTRLFKPFVQLDGSLTRRYEGTGLGLSLVSRMATMHGGSIAVESEPGKGSRFTVTLPWSASATSDYSASLELPNQTSASAPLGANEINPNAPLILIAEDNEITIFTMSTYLEAKGYRLAIARNGNEALDLARSTPPALILMDLQMPDMDGLEAMRRLRADHNQHVAQVPIIVLTALAMPGDRERALACGANEYMSKPVNLKELVGLIEQLGKNHTQ